MVTCALNVSFTPEESMIQGKTVTSLEVQRDSVAYRSGWQDGRFGQPANFPPGPESMQNSDHFAYHQGHREGSQVRKMLHVERAAL